MLQVNIPAFPSEFSLRARGRIYTLIKNPKELWLLG